MSPSTIAWTGSPTSGWPETAAMAASQHGQGLRSSSLRTTSMRLSMADQGEESPEISMPAISCERAGLELRPMSWGTRYYR